MGCVVLWHVATQCKNVIQKCNTKHIANLYYNNIAQWGCHSAIQKKQFTIGCYLLSCRHVKVSCFCNSFVIEEGYGSRHAAAITVDTQQPSQHTHSTHHGTHAAAVTAHAHTSHHNTHTASITAHTRQLLQHTHSSHHSTHAAAITTHTRQPLRHTHSSHHSTHAAAITAHMQQLSQHTHTHQPS